MTFAYPYLLLLPLLYILLRIFDRTVHSPAPFPSLAMLQQISPGIRVIIRRPILNILALLTVTAFSIGAARPQRVTIIDQPNKARNIILVLDVSKSMASPDFPEGFGFTSRLEGVKKVVAEYVRSRIQDRIGLVVFGGHAYVQSPLTTDHSIVEELVDAIYPGMAGNGTAIGEGLGVALKRIKEIDGESKAIILMTDGANNAGEIEPEKAAKVAQDLGVKIHTIGLGTAGDNIGGAIVNGLLTMGTQMGDYDEETLKSIAATTGGVYFNASSLSGLKDVYKEIEKLSESERDSPSKRLVEELYPKFALVGLLTFSIWVLLAFGIFLKVP